MRASRRALAVYHLLCTAGVLLIAPTVSRAQATVPSAREVLGLTGPTPVVMVVGTHHFANPNRDKVQMNFDDPLAPRRQAEIRDLVERLARFHPTKIAIEAPYGSTDAVERFTRYRAGQYELGPDEIDQIAFRLAQRLGQQRIYPVDYRIGINFDTVLAYADAHGQTDKAAKVRGMFSALGRVFSDRLGDSLLDIYRFENSQAVLDLNQAMYGYLAEIGVGDDYVGTEQLNRWYQRNSRIATNILRTIDSPNDRVLVLFGSGHAYLLHEILSHSPTIRLEPVASYLK